MKPVPGTPPAAPSPEVSVTRQLEISQWWPADRLLQYQMQRLTVVLTHAWETVPFYRDRLAAVGWRPGRPLSQDLWVRVPRLTRRDLQRAGTALHSRRLPPNQGKIGQTRTSGSTGTPVVALTTGHTRLMFRALTLRNQLWARRDFKATFASIRKFKKPPKPYPAGDRVERWGDALTFPFPTGPALRLGIDCSVEQQAEWLRRNNPHYLITYPSNLGALADLALRRGLVLPRLRQLATVGEVVSDEHRRACREAWGVEIFDGYSAQEVGYIALQCPDHPHLHVQGESLLVEVLDESGAPCRPGEIGRIALTTLHNLAMPLIRYEIGDLAEPGPPCPCGRGLPVLKRILGRVRNMLVTPTGDVYWPSFGLRSAPGMDLVRQHQFVQTAPDRLEARLVVTRPFTPAEEAAWREHIRVRLPYPFALDLTYVAGIPRSAGGKFEDFISEVAARQTAPA